MDMMFVYFVKMWFSIVEFNGSFEVYEIFFENDY